MQHFGTQPIHTSRLILRRFSLSDAPFMYANWASNPKVCKYMTWEPHQTIQESERLINLWVTSYQDPSSYQWIIVHKRTNTPIGAIGMTLKQDDKKLSGWQPGYVLGEDFWGQGYATEALHAMVNYFFDTTGIPTLYCMHANENIASGNVMQKVGFRYLCDTKYKRNNGNIVAAKGYKLKKENYYEQNRQK